MPDSTNRRQFERRPLAEKVFGYLDGRRVDVSSANISEGGLFLRVPESAKVPLGTRFALVFRREDALRDRIFLVARVVRHQVEPAGLGLAWVRAVTGGTAESLARFLERLVRLPAERVLSGIEPEAGSGCLVYRFATGAEPVAAVLPAEVTARGFVNGAPGLEPPPPPADCDAADVGGPVTQQIAIDAVRAPTKLRAALRTSSTIVPGTIVALGARGVVLEISSLFTGPFERLEIGFNIPADGVDRPVACAARLLAVEPLPRPGVVALDLAFDRVDEGAEPGLLGRYVRWLHHRSVTAG